MTNYSGYSVGQTTMQSENPENEHLITAVAFDTLECRYKQVDRHNALKSSDEI